MKHYIVIATRIRILIGAIIFILGLMPAGAGAASPPAAIVFPPNKALLEGAGAITILGYRKGGAPGTITVKNKGGKKDYPAAEGAFTVQVTLAPGENSLEIGERKTTVFLAGAGAAPEGFTPPDTHAVDNSCEDCHLIADGAITLAKEPPALCDGCHDEVLKGKDGKPLTVLHPPAEDGDCLACHTVHGLAIKRLSTTARRDLCFSCHNDFTSGKKNLHAPVTAGECTKCHAVHGSELKKLLLAAPARELCLKCHKDPGLMPDGGEWPVSHPALDDGCPTCHLPHFADYPRLQRKSQGVLCAECHEDKNANGDGQEWASTHQPVKRGLCSTCHRSHGASEKALLPSEPVDLCRTCHPEPHERHLRVDVNPITGKAETDKAELPPGFPIRKKDSRLGCTGCHLPHGSDNATLRPQEELTFCATCHTKY